MNRIILATLIVVALAGCLTSGEITPVRRYALEPDIQLEAMPAVDKTVGVRPFDAARPYRETMVFLDEGQELGRRFEAEWAERPWEVLTRAIVDALVATKRFADVGDAANMVRPDYILTGEVRQFRENHTTNPWQGEVEVRLVLRESRGVEQVWAGTLRAAVPMDGETATHAAQALSDAVAGIAVEAGQGIAASVN